MLLSTMNLFKLVFLDDKVQYHMMFLESAKTSYYLWDNNTVYFSFDGGNVFNLCPKCEKVWFSFMHYLKDLSYEFHLENLRSLALGYRESNFLDKFQRK